MTSVQQPYRVEDTLGIREILEIVRRCKWLIIAITSLSTAAGGFVGHRLPPSYSAAIVLAPVTTSSTGGPMGLLGSMASQLGGFASLTGISPGDSKKSESIAVLQSEFLTERYINENNLLPVLF